MVSDANGDIRNTAAPCSAMFKVAATSQRQDQVSRLIHRLHTTHATVIVISAPKTHAFVALRPPNNFSKYYSGGASSRGFNSENFTLLRVAVAVLIVANVNGEDSKYS